MHGIDPVSSVTSMNGIVAWARPDQQTLLADIRRELTTPLTGVAARSSAEAASLSKSLDVPPLTDLRRVVQLDPPAILLLLADEPPDRSIVQACVEAGTRIVSLAPWPAADADVLDFAPRMRSSPGYQAAADLLPDFGAPHAVSIVFLARPVEGTLAGRLCDAMHVLDGCLPGIEAIDATLSRPTPGVPESVSALRGHLTANVRLEDRRGASLCVSDAAGGWSRRITLNGARGTMHVSDGGFRWEADGRVIEQHVDERVWDCAALLARQLQRLLDRVDAAVPPPDHARLHGMLEAARLSCRTGHGESPSRLQELLRDP